MLSIRPKFHRTYQTPSLEWEPRPRFKLVFFVLGICLAAAVLIFPSSCSPFSDFFKTSRPYPFVGVDFNSPSSVFFTVYFRKKPASDPGRVVIHSSENRRVSKISSLQSLVSENQRIAGSVSGRRNCSSTCCNPQRIRRELFELISNYEPKKTETTNVSMRIILKDDIPVYQSARRLAFSENQDVNKQIDEWLEQEIRPSSSEYASQLY
ncbi:transposon Ty3-G Gag-Pol polyprotein [Trichonephila inaurata madagascariensis]|uniref:Transposon Ty3-G Gag-Pol polyprotein n=1 Tax=Trichonephila inaurata madagascariensis TaxID=2747483 RepID=A0A8X7CRH6_9ARAC|nr:transposon Ty3-G Gag-Pol polyprotein [Trichonephila inaurata madagascariensis]